MPTDFSNVKQGIHNFTKRIFSLSLVRINNIFDNLPLAFGQSVYEGLFSFYSHSIVNQYNNKLLLNF